MQQSYNVEKIEKKKTSINLLRVASCYGYIKSLAPKTEDNVF